MCHQYDNRVPGMNGRRLLAISISQQLFEQMVTTGFEVDYPIRCTGGIPAGAVLVGAYTEMPALNAYYVFYHPSFDVVPEDQHVPVKCVTFERMVPDASPST